MDYKEIITKVAKTFDPQQTINVTIANDNDLGEAHFVVAEINYEDEEGIKDELCIPFVIFSESEIFMPRDWQSGELPKTASDIENTEWVTYPNAHDAIVFDGLPRILTGNF